MSSLTTKDRLTVQCAKIGMIVALALYEKNTGVKAEDATDLLDPRTPDRLRDAEEAINIARLITRVIIAMNLDVLKRDPKEVVNELFSQSQQIEALHKTLADLRASKEYTIGCAAVTLATILKK